MKKEINNLLASTNETLKINQFCTLHRWTKDALGQEVDRLCVDFSLTHAFSHRYEIQSRDWRGIMAAIQDAQTKAFAAAAEEFNSQLANGYIG